MTPTAIGQTAEGPVVLWRDLGNLDLDQPFFRGTVEVLVALLECGGG